MKVVRTALLTIAVAAPALAADPPSLPQAQLQPQTLQSMKLPADPARVLKVKGPIGNLSFKGNGDIQKIASERLGAAKRTMKPVAASGPASFTISPASPRPADTNIFYRKPMSAQFNDTPGNPVSISLNTTMSRTFVEGANVPEVEVDFKVSAGNLYVADCPVWGVGMAHLRIKTLTLPATGRSWVVRQTTHLTGNTVATWIAEQDAIVRVTIQGFVPDGEDYTWGVDACRVTTIPYG